MYEKESDIILNMSGNGINNHSNLSANLLFNDINKNFLMTSIENFSTKFRESTNKPLFLQTRINTPINIINSSDKIVKDNFYKSVTALPHKKREQFSNNKSELLTLRNINDNISVRNISYSYD